MRYIGVLIFFLILFSCNTRQQTREETTTPDSSQAVATPDGTNSLPDTAVTETLPAAEPFKRSANQLENFRTITNFQPGKSAAELSIRDFVRVLGPSSQTVKDSDSSCSIGQLHFWNVNDQNIRIFALGDEYTPKENKDAPCRLYGIQLMNEKQTSSYEGFLGIQLGEEENAVEEKLKAFVQQNPTYHYKQLRERSAVERFLTERQKSVFVLTNGKQYYHFAIGKKHKLNYILISAINVQEAC